MVSQSSRLLYRLVPWFIYREKDSVVGELDKVFTRTTPLREKSNKNTLYFCFLMSALILKNQLRKAFHFRHCKPEPRIPVVEIHFSSMTASISLGIVASVLLNKIFTTPHFASQMFFVWPRMSNLRFINSSFSEVSIHLRN